MATNARNRRLEPSYKQHAAVDDACGVVLDVEVTTGEVNEGRSPRADRRGGRDDRRAIRNGDRRAGLRLRQDLRRARAARDRRRDPGQGGADPQPGSLAPLPLRRPARHAEMPAGQDAAAQQARSKHGRFFYSRARDCRAATAPRSACRRGGPTRPSWSATTIPRCFAPVAAGSAGARRTSDSTSATAGARRASTARRRPGTGWPAPSAAACRTCASRPSSPPPRSTSSGSPQPFSH